MTVVAGNGQTRGDTRKRIMLHDLSRKPRVKALPNGRN